ncbi:MAG: hypothetical protein WD646_14600 [Actinomycetota bacterium]
MGWFDHLKAPDRLPGMRSAGMNNVMPYTGMAEDVRPYLDRALRAGVKVFVEIDRLLLVAPDPTVVSLFIENYRHHPAVYGWLLMDEPTIDPDFRAVTPSMAKTIYRRIKAVDPKHPVGIVFGVKEDPRPWRPAMDVMLFDDYVQSSKVHEFWGLDRWRARLINRASIASSLRGYMPVLQAYGQDAQGRPQREKRLPTSREIRYMVYTAVQNKATGLFFWNRNMSLKGWIDKVMTPVSKEIAPALRAIAGGPVRGSSTSERRVRSTVFRDSRTKALYLVVVHNGGGTRKAQIKIDPKLGVSRARRASHGAFYMSGGKFVDKFGPYGARLYRLA